MTPAAVTVQGFELQADPPIFFVSVPGKWLLSHSTTSWRLDDPEKGFQRVVREDRARQIASAVLDQGRTFPNAIVLATDVRALACSGGSVTLPKNLKLLVVDGQHRLWAQKFAKKEMNYACLIHLRMSEVQMAKLFLEINDTQKRVPSSLRWDLVRLVRPEDDAYLIAAADLVHELSTNRDSALFQRIDMTGEQPELKLKQASIAPELKALFTSRKEGFKGIDLEELYDLTIKYLAALKARDSDGWRSGDSPFLKARVFRALLKLLPDVVRIVGKAATEVTTADLRKIVGLIDMDSLDSETIKAHQGSAGIKEIYEMLKEQIEA